MITPKIGRSMLSQLDRVNSDPTKLREEARDLRERIEWLTQENRALKTENQGLREIVDALPEDHPGIKRLMDWDGRKLGHRPVISITEASVKAGVGYWTAYRYVTNSDWDAVQINNREWLVYADQPLTVKAKRTSKKGKKK